MLITGVCPAAPTKDKVTVCAETISSQALEDYEHKHKIGRINCPLTDNGFECPYGKCKMIEQHGYYQ